MQDQLEKTKNHGLITYEELIAMPIGERKIAAERILASGASRDAKRSVSGWGCFADTATLTDSEIESEARRILSAMTLEQKVRQMTPNTTVEQYIPACIKYNDFPYVAGEDPDLDIPGIRFSDGPAGVVMGDASTSFPVSMGRGATWDVELEERVGEAMGIEARSLGANLFGGVCINLLRHPAWGRSQETYGEDPVLLGCMGSALLRGVQKHVMACVKHYALNSMENGRYKVNVNIDERSLREMYLPHFKTCVDEGAAAIMSAYNKVRGSYCGENSYLLREVLKREWAFKGFVISDFIHGFYDTQKAVEAGLDIEMPIEGHYGRHLVDLVRQGLVSESVVDEAVMRILSTKMRFSKIGGRQPYGAHRVASPEHVQLAKLVALKSAVLLKNRDRLLPLDRKTLRNLVVAGPLASKPNIGEMKGSSHVYPPYVVTPLEGLSRAVDSSTKLTYLSSVADAFSETVVQKADAVVIVVGLTSDDEGEYIPHWNSGCGGDRSDLKLPQFDRDLIETISRLNDRSIVVIQGGGAIITHPWDQSVGALLMTWYPGMEGGNALAEILFGTFNPCGRLPITIPASMDQLPYFDKDTEEITYDYFHGYFLADRMAYPVSYPFGYGLSYTSFSYDDLEIETPEISAADTLRISVIISNTGRYAGEEVVQLYIGYLNSSVMRHEKDLRAFEKVTVLPGESTVVRFSLPAEKLAYWDDEEKDWKVEHIAYVAYVGSSSSYRDLLSEIFTVV